MAAFCMLQNVHDVLPCGKTAYEKRFNESFRGAIIPLGAAVTFKPSNPKDIESMPEVGKKDRDGIFIGYDQKHGGGYTDNMWVLDGIKLTNVETTDEVHSERVHEKEITVLKDVKATLSFRLSPRNGDNHLTAEK